MGYVRRKSEIITLSVGVILLASAGLVGQQQSSDSAALRRANPPAQSTLTLLGTASGPGGHPQRAGIASLLTVNGTDYLIDAGEAVSFQFARAGHTGSIPQVFLTHLHSDHTAGLLGLVAFRRSNMTVYGPPRTDDFIAALVAADQFNAEIRDAGRAQGTSSGRNTSQERAVVGKVVQPGPVYRDDNISVDAIENTHYTFGTTPASRNKSYSYRVRTPDRVFVFTGDTGWSDALVQFASGADVLVAEMVSPTELGPNPDFHMTREHLSPTEVGRLAAAAKVKMVIASHVRPSLAEDLAEIRRHFGGGAIIGEDLMKF